MNQEADGNAGVLEKEVSTQVRHEGNFHNEGRRKSQDDSCGAGLESSISRPEDDRSTQEKKKKYLTYLVILKTVIYLSQR